MNGLTKKSVLKAVTHFEADTEKLLGSKSIIAGVAATKDGTAYMLCPIGSSMTIWAKYDVNGWYIG